MIFDYPVDRQSDMMCPRRGGREVAFTYGRHVVAAAAPSLEARDRVLTSLPRARKSVARKMARPRAKWQTSRRRISPRRATGLRRRRDDDQVASGKNRKLFSLSSRGRARSPHVDCQLFDRAATASARSPFARDNPRIKRPRSIPAPPPRPLMLVCVE